jgi:branched-chain amino acid transport system ATP-binding protein
MKMSVQDLHVAYQGIHALKGVDLHVGEGEMVALIGSNGAGKSTLLNCMSGLVRQSQGAIVFDGKPLGRTEPHNVSRLGLLHVPEGRQVLGEMTVLENLQIGEIARGSRPSAYDLRKVYGLFPILDERKEQLAGTLSGGQQQMLAIGRALMGGPLLLLLDEPSLGLSPLLSDQVFDALTQLNKEGLPILLVEQNAHKALAITSRAYILERGRVAFEGNSADLASNPKVVELYLGH